MCANSWCNVSTFACGIWKIVWAPSLFYDGLFVLASSISQANIIKKILSIVVYCFAKKLNVVWWGNREDSQSFELKKTRCIAISFVHGVSEWYWKISILVTECLQHFWIGMRHAIAFTISVFDTLSSCIWTCFGKGVKYPQFLLDVCKYWLRCFISLK